MSSHQEVLCVPCAKGVLVADKFSVCGSAVYRLRYSEVGLFYPIGLANSGWLNLTMALILVLSFISDINKYATLCYEILQGT